MNFKTILKSKNITQADVVKALNVTQPMASMLISGKRKVPISKLAAWEKLTGIPRKQFRPELFK